MFREVLRGLFCGVGRRRGGEERGSREGCFWEVREVVSGGLGEVFFWGGGRGKGEAGSGRVVFVVQGGGEGREEERVFWEGWGGEGVRWRCFGGFFFWERGRGRWLGRLGRLF